LDRVPDEEASAKIIVIFFFLVFLSVSLLFNFDILGVWYIHQHQPENYLFLFPCLGIDGCWGRAWASCAGIIAGVILSLKLMSFCIFFPIEHILWNVESVISYSLVIFVTFICRPLKKLGGGSKFMQLKRIQMQLLPCM